MAKLAQNGGPGRFKLPRPMLHSGNFDFSFSGLKTAVFTSYAIRRWMRADRADLAAEFQEAVTEVLVRQVAGRSALAVACDGWWWRAG